MTVHQRPRCPGTVAIVVMSIGTTLFVIAFAWAQAPSAPYLALGPAAVVGVLTALAGLVAWRAWWWPRPGRPSPRARR